ncbi:MAG: hypothetical protein ACJA0U_003251 [Salibacteraceae bacterium]|jgi:hypothetical protein
MKLKMMFLSLAFLLVANVASAFTIKYYNKDSKNYTMEVKSNGSTSIQTSASEVQIKTSCGWVTVKDGCVTVE